MKAYHLMGKPPYFTNCYLLTDNTGHAVMIDCSAEIEKVEKILKNDRCHLRAIILTHGHEDHRETLSETMEHFNTTSVYLGQEDIDQFGLDFCEPLRDKAHFTIGEIKMVTFHTPGHTPGGYCIMCEDMLFSGDTLFAGTIGRTDFEGGDYATLKESLKTILDMVKGDMKVLPGHNGFSTMEREKAQNPYVKSVM